MGKAARLKKERQDAEKSAFFTKAENKARRREIRRQILELQDEFYKNQIYVILYAIHKIYGFGPVRMKRFFDLYTETHEELREYYGYTLLEGETTDITNWLARRQLIAYGIDVDAWLKEYEEKKKQNANRAR